MYDGSRRKNALPGMKRCYRRREIIYPLPKLQTLWGINHSVRAVMLHGTCLALNFGFHFGIEV